MSLKEALNQEKKLTKEMMADMSAKQKLSYIWDYYKWHIMVILGVIFVIVYLVVHYLNLKDELMLAALVNFSAIETREEEFKNSFMEYAGIDTDKCTVDITDDITLGLGMSFNTAYGGQDLMAAYIGGEQLDVICTGDNVFFDYAYESTVRALPLYMSDEEIEKYSGRLYYVDEAVVEGYTKAIRDMDYDYSAEAPDPRHPEKMEKPVPVGIYVDDSYWLNEYYVFNDEKAEHLVVGVIANSHRAEFSKKFLEFLTQTEP